MPVVIDGTNGITTPDVESTGPITGTTGAFSGNVTANGVATELRPLVLGTAQNSTSGTVIDFTGIPSWVRRISVMLNGVSTSGTGSYLVQIGSGSVQTSGYQSCSNFVSLTANTTSGSNFVNGFGITSANATNAYFGTMVLTLLTGNSWVSSSAMSVSFSGAGAGSVFGGGAVGLSGTPDRLRITTTNGTDTFDAGTINIMYE